MPITRRAFTIGLAASRALLNTFSETGAPTPESACSHVDPFIGTGGFGHCFPAATLPFGAVQLGPDTGDRGWNHCSGYHRDDTHVLGFSHTHLSGTGVGDMQDFRVMPAIPGSFKNSSPESFARRFVHNDEAAEPGYYRVQLRDPEIQVELTASEHCGMHRYTFAEGHAVVLVDLSNVWQLQGDLAPGQKGSLIDWASLDVKGSTLSGGRCTQAWAKGRELFFYAEFSSEPRSVQIVGDGKQYPSGTSNVRGRKVHAIFRFDSPVDNKLLLRLGISALSVEGARRNLLAEMPSWRFEEVREHAWKRWSDALSTVAIADAGKRREKRIFYTALYHSMLSPTIFDDVDGRYRGMDGKVHTLSGADRNYSTFSTWDTYRGLHPLLTLLCPELVPGICNCIVRQSMESPSGAIVWPLQGHETGCMDGYHSVAIVAEAIAKQFPGINVADAYLVYRRRALMDDYRGLQFYRRFGYVPCDLSEQSASRTCNYAYDDHCVATIAEAAGKHDEAEALRKRSMSYRNVFDSGTGFIRPRMQDGRWASPFDPKAITITHKWRDYEEANGWQTTFLAQHDSNGLCDLLGGKEGLEAKLDGLFAASSDLPQEMLPPDITGLIGQYCHGNEPSHHIVFLYNVAGRPDKAQAHIHEIMTTLYNDSPDALAGNEDCGQMSAWYCLNAMGIYPIDPVSASYQIGTPLFDEMVLRVGRNRTLRITASRESEKSIFVKSVEINGRPIGDFAIAHQELASGGVLKFELTDKPATSHTARKRERT